MIDHNMRAEFNAWAKDRGCDTDGAWSAWQAAWNLRSAGVPATPAPKREAPPGKWRVDMPDGTYGKMPGDPPGPASVRAVIGGYVYDVEPRTGRLFASEVPRCVPVLVAVNPAMDQGPCTVCGVPWEKHGSYPTCASHPYTADGNCQHVIGATCAGAECRNGCVSGKGVQTK